MADSEAPVVVSFSASPSNVMLLTSSPTSTLIITANLSDNVGIASTALVGGSDNSPVPCCYCCSCSCNCTTSMTRRWRKVMNYADFQLGTSSYAFTLTVTDAAGNVTTGSLTVGIIKTDDQVPIIHSLTVSPETVILTVETPAVSVTVTAQASDNVAVATAILTNTSTSSEVSGGAVNGNTYTWTLSFAYADYSYGTATVPYTLVVKDQAGNIAVETFEVIVKLYTYETAEVNNSVSITANLNAGLLMQGWALGIQGGTVSNTDTAFTAVYNLPTGSATVDLGAVTGNNPDGGAAGTFDAVVTLNASSDGQLTAEVALTGNPVVASVPDNFNEAQHVYWPNEPTPSLTSTSADVLTSSLTGSEAEAILSTELAAVKAMYTHGLIESWKFELMEVPCNITSVINQYALAKGRSYPNVFQNGDTIALATALPYSVTVTDINDATVTVVPSTSVYALVTHSDSGPSIIGSSCGC